MFLSVKNCDKNNIDGGDGKGFPVEAVTKLRRSEGPVVGFGVRIEAAPR